MEKILNVMTTKILEGISVGIILIHWMGQILYEVS